MRVVLQYSERARKQLLTFEQKIAQRIVQKIYANTQSKDPLSNAKRLTGPLEGKYRYHIGDYCAIFTYEKRKIVLLTILTISHRKDIYKK